MRNTLFGNFIVWPVGKQAFNLNYFTTNEQTFSVLRRLSQGRNLRWALPAHKAQDVSRNTHTYIYIYIYIYWYSCVCIYIIA